MDWSLSGYVFICPDHSWLQKQVRLRSPVYYYIWLLYISVQWWFCRVCCDSYSGVLLYIMWRRYLPSRLSLTRVLFAFCREVSTLWRYTAEEWPMTASKFNLMYLFFLLRYSTIWSIVLYFGVPPIIKYTNMAACHNIMKFVFKSEQPCIEIHWSMDGPFSGKVQKWTSIRVITLAMIVFSRSLVDLKFSRNWPHAFKAC